MRLNDCNFHKVATNGRKGVDRRRQIFVCLNPHNNRVVQAGAPNSQNRSNNDLQPRVKLTRIGDVDDGDEDSKCRTSSVGNPGTTSLSRLPFVLRGVRVATRVEK